MAQSWLLRIYENTRLVYDTTPAGCAELGRQRVGEPDPYCEVPTPPTNGSAGPIRIIMARLQEEGISRQHLRLEPLGEGKYRVTNLSKYPVPCASGVAMTPSGGLAGDAPLIIGETRIIRAPLNLWLGPRRIAVEDPAAVTSPSEGLHELDHATLAPGSLKANARGFRSLPGPMLNATQIDAVVDWLQPTMNVLQSTVGSADFLTEAAFALVTILGLNSGRVLLWNGTHWSIAAEETAAGREPTSRPSQLVLDLVRQSKRTIWRTPGSTGLPGGHESASLRLVDSVVASPILDRTSNVIGALYGDRSKYDASRPITKLEAMLVELLACGLATGLSRLKQESAAVAARIQFEQFFTPELARQLAVEPNMLEGREAQVSVLFCDIRGFSRICERLSPSETVRWIGDTMGSLSECVLAEAGVLVDYIGDELIAMWGAPRDQPDHAAQAARTALAMLDRLPGLNVRWEAQLGEPIQVGIGVNTGVACVGNIGSKHKFKYGPLGNTVNLASRVQGATKYLKCRLLVTSATKDRLNNSEFIGRRVCKTRVANIKEPVDLYEVELFGTEDRQKFFQSCETALNVLENGDPLLAARMASDLLLEHPKDGPLRLILSRGSKQLLDDSTPLDVVWELPGK